MHITHTFVIMADSPKEACEYIHYETENWGTEDNHKQVIGAISEDDEVYSYNDCTAFMLEEDCGKTIAEVVENLKKEIYDPHTWDEVAKEILEALAVSPDDVGPSATGTVVKYLIRLQEVKSLPPREEFDIWNDTYFSGEFDREGLTNCIPYEPSGKKKYVVFLDVHR